jgi:transposase
MATLRLNSEEVKKRLIRLHNLEYLHEQQRFKIGHLREENRELRKEVAALKVTVSEQQKTIDDLQLQIEELRMIVFGRKKKKDDQNDDLLPPKEKTPRTSDSYKRPLPEEQEITEVKPHPIDACVCGMKMIKKQRVVFYEEDIPIPAKKIVRKHTVEKAYCPKCTKWRTAYPLPNHKAILGLNAQKYICYLNVICRLSFAQIQNVLQDTYALKISQGEIAKILERESVRLRPFYEQLMVNIRGEPGVHLDETGWKLLIDGSQSYSWVMSGTNSKESIFLVGESRGKGNVEKLLGESFDGFVVSDDYGAYKKLKNHQLCWAHVLRKFRDLARSQELSDTQRKQCREEYATLSFLYDDLKHYRRTERYNEFAERLARLSTIRPNDPKKLIRIKTTLAKNIPNYLTCLSDPEIPLTNNQAERSLRHLVLKRKISFGSLTKRTAEHLAILLSVLLSLKQRYQSGFFMEYLRV